MGNNRNCKEFHNTHWSPFDVSLLLMEESGSGRGVLPYLRRQIENHKRDFNRGLVAQMPNTRKLIGHTNEESAKLIRFMALEIYSKNTSHPTIFESRTNLDIIRLYEIADKIEQNPNLLADLRQRHNRR